MVERERASERGLVSLRRHEEAKERTNTYIDCTISPADAYKRYTSKRGLKEGGMGGEDTVSRRGMEVKRAR